MCLQEHAAPTKTINTFEDVTIRYRYLSIAIDKPWKFADSNRSAFFQNLPPTKLIHELCHNKSLTYTALRLEILVHPIRFQDFSHY